MECLCPKCRKKKLFGDSSSNQSRGFWYSSPISLTSLGFKSPDELMLIEVKGGNLR